MTKLINRLGLVVAVVFALCVLSVAFTLMNGGESTPNERPSASPSASPASPEEDKGTTQSPDNGNSESGHCVLDDGKPVGMDAVFTDHGPLLFAEVPVLMGCYSVPDIATLWCGGGSPEGPTTVCIRNGSETDPQGYNTEYDCGPKVVFLRSEELVHAPVADALACRLAS